MPPKPSTSKGPSKKTEQKKKDKVVEDKTFGLKNKKGAKQQKFIQQVVKQVGNPRKGEEKKEEKKDDLPLFKPVQKVEKGADPKSILCAFFKQGQCAKGDKCKFSHDLTVERKSEKRSLYVDMREDEPETMETWDDDKLKDVVEKKHGKEERTKTEIICKHFLEAVEKSKYGWFWECPVAGCIYRHALPPGFVLKKDLKKENKENEIGLEEWIESERGKLKGELTKVTVETFVGWKKRKVEEKIGIKLEKEREKLVGFKAGRSVGLSGRDMFTFNPELAVETLEDLDEALELNYESEEEIEYKEIDFNFEEAPPVEKLEKLKIDVEIDEDLFDDEL